MNNVVRLQVSSLLIPGLISWPASLRWLRRTMTLILILANFAIVLWSR